MKKNSILQKLEDQPLISVIVPVYNVEQYLHRCVDSIRIQTYTNLEIILVDDGSPDRCGEICDEYAAQDSRVKVIHQENGGLSAARNAGLDACTGEYVAFVDSDDYIMPEMYATMIDELLKQNVDICICQWQYEFADGRQVVDAPYVNKELVEKMTSSEFARFMFKGAYENGVVIAAWNKLYKRHIFDEIRFTGRYMEDDAIHSRIFSENFDVYVVRQQFYIYTENVAGLTHQAFRPESLRMLDIMSARVELFHTDKFMVREAKRTYCNLYIEYYYKAKSADISMPSRNMLRKYTRDLVCTKSCNVKFFVRMILFMMSPMLYQKLTSR
ncbi:MAG: glycosyltransferase [Clostridia bacterium]|nr:glycosyltransferase [Clostridia bacterium]